MNRLALALVLVAAIGAAVLYALLSGGGELPDSRAGAADGSTAVVETRESDDGAPAVAESRQPGPGDTAAPGMLTTRVHLWRIEEPAGSAGRAAFGAGRSTLLTGRVVKGTQPIENTTVKITGGLDKGLEARTGPEGEYALSGLYPGLAILEFEPPGQPKVVRQVLLRRGFEESLDIDCEGFGNVRGTVRGIDGKPIAGARVELDGAIAETDKAGAFYFSGVVSGDCILYMSAPGHESRRALLPLRPNQALETDNNGFVLRPSEPLTVGFDLLSTGEEPPFVVLLPGEGQRERNFPYEKLGIQQLRPGDSTIRIEGIPTEEPFQLRAAGAGGVSNPGMRPVFLRRGDTNLSKATFKFVWKSPIRGKVLSGGKPLANARARIECSDLARATEELIREGPGVPPPIPIAPLPFVKRLTRTDQEGAFRLESGDVPTPFLLVIEAEGHERKVLTVKPGASDIGSVELARSRAESPGGLTLEFQRVATRQLSLYVNSKTTPKKTLAAGERVEIGALAPGFYGLRVQEENEEESLPVFERMDIKIPSTLSVKIPSN